MKRLFIIFAAVTMTTSVMAQHEIGLIAGGMNGLSYKYWCSDRFAVQTDLVIGLTVAPGTLFYKGNSFGSSTNPQYDFTLNPDFEYHFPLSTNLQLYTGGGLNLGLMSDLTNVDPNLIWGKFGLNGIIGLSLLTCSNISLAIDFRPGYGLGFYNADTVHFSFFDWKVGLSVRYRI